MFSEDGRMRGVEAALTYIPRQEWKPGGVQSSGGVGSEEVRSRVEQVHRES